MSRSNHPARGGLVQYAAVEVAILSRSSILGGTICGDIAIRDIGVLLDISGDGDVCRSDSGVQL